MKLPIRSLGLVAAGLLLGTALAPVAAQQSGLDGQVAVRSDGAVYLISNGQRRWVATVVISDDEINAYPEGEPVFVGLAPMGSGGQTAAANPAPKPSASPAAGSSAPASGSSAQPKPAAASQPASADPPPPAGPTPDPALATVLPIDVDVAGSTKIEAGTTFRVQIKTLLKKDITCDLTVRLPNGKESNEDSKVSDGQGKCQFNIDIPGDLGDGLGALIGSVRDGGKVNQQTVEFQVVKKK